MIQIENLFLYFFIISADFMYDFLLRYDLIRFGIDTIYMGHNIDQCCEINDILFDKVCFEEKVI